MKLEKGKQYTYHFDCIAECGEHKGQRVQGDILVTFEGIEDARGFNCDQCGKDLKKGFLFVEVENKDNGYYFGSECVKKVIGLA